MKQRIRLSRERTTQADTLDDGCLANWLSLARQIITLAGLDYIAATYPDCATSWINRNLVNPSLDPHNRQALLEAIRCELEDFWMDGGGEFADFSGRADYTYLLYRVTAPRLPGESPHRARRRIQNAKARAICAFANYAGRGSLK